MELKDTKALVENLLREYPALRADDDLLYLEVLKRVNPHWNNSRINTGIQNISIGEFFAERKRRGLPSFESVRRSRAKIMEEHPELKPCEKVQKGREEQRGKYYDMATDWKNLKQQSLDF